MKNATAPLAMAFVLVALTGAQSPTTFGGRIVSDATDDPIPNVRVSLLPVAPGTPVVLTDSDGRFSLAVPRGAFRVAVSKSGYARKVVTLESGILADIRLERGAALSGRVVDAFGDPYPVGRALVSVHVASAPDDPALLTTTPDDHGEYRLAPLPAGQYLVSFSLPRMSFNQRELIVFFPAAAVAKDGQVLTLRAGDEQDGVDGALPAEAPTLPNIAPGVENVVGTLNSSQTAGQARPAVPSAGAVRGRVLTSDGRAVPYARVVLSRPSKEDSRIATAADAGGVFEFRDVAPANYRIVATKNGYASVAASGLSFDLADAERRERVDLTLARWSAITGRIYDELGDSLQDVVVQLLRVRYEAGRRRLMPVAGSRLSDDRGRFRLFAVPPGQYIVSASAGGVLAAELPGYGRTYYPGTPVSGDAQYVTVAAEAEVTGIDFGLTRTPTARITGRVIDSRGQGTSAGSLTLIASQRSTTLASVSVGARTSPDGTFEFPNVPPGLYVIRADRSRSNPSTEGELGTLTVGVDGTDVAGLVVQTLEGSSIKGRFTFDSYKNTPAPQRSALELRPIPVDFDQAPGMPASADIHPDWTFDLAGVTGPRRLQLTRMPADWALKEVRVNGIDATDRPLSFGRRDQSLSGVEVVLTDRVNELTGTVADDRGSVASGASVIVFPSARSLWYSGSRFLRLATAGGDGAFHVTGLPFGSFYVSAVAQPPTDGDEAWTEPAYLESLLTRASSVTLGEGQTVSLNLRLAPR